MIPLTIQILFLFLAVLPPVRQLMLDAAVPAYDPLPLPADQPSRTQLFNDTMLARNRRTLVDAYLKVGQRDPKWDGPMIAFLDGIALTMSHQKNEPDSQTLLDQADQLLALGCTDPMLLYGRAFCLIGVRRSAEAKTALRSVLVTRPRASRCFRMQTTSATCSAAPQMALNRCKARWMSPSPRA